MFGFDYVAGATSSQARRRGAPAGCLSGTSAATVGRPAQAQAPSTGPNDEGTTHGGLPLRGSCAAKS